jgi:glycosyltransferase involved in cell wall biosynthesis
VHTHSSKAGILGRAAAAKLRLPVVHTIHGASFHYGQSALAYQTYVALEKLAARWTDQFISVADDMSEEYIRAGVAPRERFTTIYSGFDVEPYLNPPRPPAEVRRELGLSPEEIVVGKVGRLFHLKGHEFVIQAAPAVVAANPRVKFLLVGDGILRQQYESEIARLGLSKHFVFTGLVPPDRIPELMSAMDLVVHASQWEGLARVLPQALLAGKPVISYDVGGAREVVIPGRTGFLLPRDSVQPLASAILELAADSDLRDRYGQTGRQLCRDRFRHQTMTARIQEVYEQMLQDRCTP